MPNTATEIKIVITADGKVAVAEVQKIGDATKQLETDTGSFIGRIKGHWLGLTATVIAAYATISKGRELAEMYASYEDQRNALNRLAGSYNTTAGQIVESSQRAAKGAISTADATRILAENMMRGLNPEQLTNIARISEALGDVTGKRVTPQFESLAMAVSLGRERMEESALGVIDLRAKFGELYDTMTQQERQHALYNVVLERGSALIDQIGSSSLSTADKLEASRARMENLRLEIGELIVKGGYALYAAFEIGAAGVLYAYSAIARVIGSLGWFQEKLVGIMGLVPEFVAKWTGLAFVADLLKRNQIATGEWRAESEIAWSAASDLFKKGSEDFALAFKKNEETMAKFKPPALLDPERNQMLADQVLKIMREMHARESMLGLQNDQLQLAQMQARQNEELRQLTKLRATEAEMDEAGRIHKLERDELVRHATLEREHARALAMAEITAQEISDRIAEEDKLNQFRVQAGKMTEEEALRKRYEGEREVLRAKWDVINAQIIQTKNDAEVLKLLDQTEEVQKKINALYTAQAYQTDLVRIANQTKMLDLVDKEKQWRTQMYESSYASLVQIVNLMDTAQAKWTGMMVTGMKGITDVQTQRDAFSKMMDELRSQYAQRLVLAGKMSQGELNILREQGQKEQTITLQNLLAKNGMEQQAANFSIQMERTLHLQKLQIYSSYVDMVAGALGSVMSIMQGNYLAIFLLSKALAIAQAIVYTHMAAIAAAASVAILGPVAAEAAAAKMLALGYAMVAVIAATAVIGAATGSYAPSTGVVSGAGGGYATVTPTAPILQPQQQARPAPVVNVYVYGNVIDQDKFAREFLPSIRKALSDNA
jgi:hypothetical protein